MWSRAATLCLAAIAVLACAVPVAAAPPSAAQDEVRIVMGKLRGLQQADEDHPVRVNLRAEGDSLVGVRVVLRNEDDEVVGRSKRFRLPEGERKDVRIEVDGPLPRGQYFARVKGRTG